MNEAQRLRMLEEVTSRRGDSSDARGGLGESVELRSAWQRLSADLRDHDETLNTDEAEFIARTVNAVAGNSPAPAPHVAADRAAIVACGRHADEPVGWRGWLALVVCVAVCGSAILWFDFGDDAAPVVQVEKPNAEQGKQQQPATLSSPTSDDAVEPVTAEPLTTEQSPEWTDPVDDAIALARQQLVAMQGSTKWDRSVEAFERYRQSVEQDMNEWEL